MHRGYIKLWRKSFDSIIWKNKKLWIFWTYCLLKATYKECNQLVGFQEIKLLPGQFVFGRKQASLDTGLSEQTIRTCIKKLEQNQKKISLKTTNKFSIITVENWHTYQQTENGTNQQVTSKQPASNHKQECKECKEEKNNVRFNDFWNMYPKKTGKKPCATKWKLRKLDQIAEQIISDVEWRIKNDQKWLEGFIPNPLTYINQDRWEDEKPVEQGNIIYYTPEQAKWLKEKNKWKNNYAIKETTG